MGNKLAFKGKTVWVTGASSGIGRALCVAFSKAGAICILSARSEQGLEETRALLDEPAKHIVLPLDVTDYTKVDYSTRIVIESYEVDILINNAGVSQRSIVLETDMEVYRRLMEVNYFGVVHLSKLMLPYFIKKGKGSIVTVSSIAGKVGPAYRSGYAASKHALHGFFDSMRAETSHLGIHTMLVCPGYIDTPIAHNALAGDGNQYGKKDIENASGLTPDVLANRVLKSILQKKTEVYIGKFEVNAVRLKRFLPQVLTKMLSKKYLEDPAK